MNTFIMYLFSMFFFDFLGYIFYFLREERTFLFNLMSFFEFNLILYFYYQLVKKKRFKKNVKTCIWIFNIGYLLTSLYYGINIFNNLYNSLVLLLGSFLVLIVSILYLREFLLSDNVINYKKDITFWITVGIMIYYSGTIPLTATINYFISEKVVYVLYKIQNLLTIGLHSCFIIGFLWSLKKNKL